MTNDLRKGYCGSCEYFEEGLFGGLCLLRMAYRESDHRCSEYKAESPPGLREEGSDDAIDGEAIG